jgi:DNA polymerase-3 subunit gamma/tau
MSYQVIARKWRPQTFEEVTGQEHITQTLRNALEYDRLHHAYLFSGARGVGKTTTARLLAKALNCHKTKDKPNLTPCRTTDSDVCPSCLEIAESRSLDVLEIDAASHTGIDDVRDTIIQNIDVNPARDRYKVFIIDEVHQLSKPAFNALLKTLEEPPPNVVFVMATTELHKVPETILSRCQQFEFRTIPNAKIFDRLKLIADAEKVAIDDEALREISRSGRGSMRDAQSNFDQVISFSGDEISAVDVTNALGIASSEMLSAAIRAIEEHNSRAMIEIVEDLTARGQDLRNFCRDLMAVVRDLSVYKISDDADLISGSSLDPAALRDLSQPFGISDLVRIFNSLAETETSLKEAVQSRFMLEIGLVKLVEMRRLAPIESILERLSAIENNGVELPEVSVAATGERPSPRAQPERGPDPEQEKKTLKSASPPDDEWPERDLDSLEPPDLSDEPPAESLPQDPEPMAAAPIVDLGFLETSPLKLPPISSEDLEHVDDERLDNAFEAALARSGDDLLPIASAREIISRFETTFAAAAGSNGSGVAPAREPTHFQVPQREIDADPVEIPVLSDSPTEQELVAYFSAQPEVRRVMRALRARVLSVS